MKAPFLNVADSYHELSAEIDESIRRVLNSGRYIGGDELEGFESEYAAYCESKYAIGTGSGLDALRIILNALEIGPGDEVLVPANTFIATWLAVSQVGAIPIPVLPKNDTYNMDPADIARHISPRTKCILVVHLYGQPAELDWIIDIADKYNLLVVEDAAQAHGAKYNDRMIGSHSAAAAWSFYPAKNLGCYGDGGAITTNDQRLADKIRKIGNYGSESKHCFLFKGLNSRLDPIQCAILRVKLKKLSDWNRRRNNIANMYMEKLDGLNIVIPVVIERAVPSWHLFVIRTTARDDMKNYLSDYSIETQVHYPTPPYLQPAYSEDYCDNGPLAACTAMTNEILSLPIGPHMEKESVDLIVDAISKFQAARE